MIQLSLSNLLVFDGIGTHANSEDCSHKASYVLVVLW